MTNKEYIDLLLKLPNKRYQDVENLFQMLRLYENENFEEAHKINKLVKKLCAVGSKSKSEDYAKYFRLYKLAYLFDAPYEFDSYLIFVEWDREPSKRFYLPRRKVFKQIVDKMQMLEDDYLDLLSISLPPGTGKTTLECFFLSWVMGRHPDMCNLSSAHGDKLTKGIYEQVLTIITDEEYLYNSVFPNVTLQAVNSKEETINLNKPKRFKTLTCRSIDGGLTGATRCEGYLCCDDLVSGIEEALNLERLERLWNKFGNDLKSRKKKNCKEIHIATRWSVHDVIGRLQVQYSENGRACFIKIPALNEDGKSNFDFDYDVGFSTHFFEDIRDSLDEISWRCLYQNEPIEREGLLFHPDELNYFNGELPGELAEKIITFCDVAWGGGDSLSMPFMYKYGENGYIVDVIFNKSNKEITRPIVVGKILQHRPTEVRFEANNGGDEYADKVNEELKKKGFKTLVSHRKAPTTTSKISRIVQASPEIKKLYFLDRRHQNKEYREFMKELTSFMTTGKNKHDDAPDSLAGLVNLDNYGVNKPRVIERPF